MSEIFEGLHHFPRADRVCHVAYTLNETQPVICTHIGDQPLYYIDETDIDEDDGAMFDETELGALAGEIDALKYEVDGFDTSAVDQNDDALDAMLKFSECATDISTESAYARCDKEKRLRQIIDCLKQSRLAVAYLTCAEQYNVSFDISTQVEGAFYDRKAGTITLYPFDNMNDQLMLVARELRRHWQHRQGTLIHPLHFQPEHAILINRAQEADLAVSMIRIAWELQLAGHKDVWERVEHSPMADLARAFAREAFLDFRTLNNGIASAAVFEAWFLSERCRGLDKLLIQKMLSDSEGYLFGDAVQAKNITIDLIATLGEMPFGKNYLAQHAAIILDDPIFTDVRDRSSANFLWFIKFERKFKETEHDLQIESDLSTHDIRHDILNRNSQDPEHDTQQCTNIIQFLEYREKAIESTVSQPRKRKRSGGAEIIDINHWTS